MPRRLHRLGLAAAHQKWVFLLLWLVALVIVGALSHAAGSNTSNNLDLPGTDSQAATDGMSRVVVQVQNTTGPSDPGCRGG